MKIGIITMHKVYNFGSALQAFALQQYIKRKFNYDVEIIDYLYPNKYHLTYKDETLLQKVKHILRPLRKFLKHEPERKKNMKMNFDSFHKKYFNLSLKSYNSIEEIMNDPPKYDIYLTGSDQVWNYAFIKEDPVFFCEFASSGSKRVSFGSSFSSSSLPQKYYEKYNEYLNKYSYIGVREISSLKQLALLGLDSNIKCICTCDPTFLLSSEDYFSLCRKPSFQIPKEYILIYKLTYSFNSSKKLREVAQIVSKHYNCTTVIIGEGDLDFVGDQQFISGIGPCEFLWLFYHAKYVISSSFHGTAFSVIFRKPFVSVFSQNSQDCRIRDFLNIVGLQNNMVDSESTEVNVSFDSPFNNDFESRLNEFVSQSSLFLAQELHSM